jgi:hypothetical protein
MTKTSDVDLPLFPGPVAAHLFLHDSAVGIWKKAMIKEQMES